jgi:beta-glucosidase
MLVVGPLADQRDVLLGNYNGTPTHTVSVLEGLKQEFPTVTIRYAPGTQFLSNSGDPVPASVFSTADGRPGLEAEYRLGLSLESPSAPIITRVEPAVSLNEHTLPEQVRGKSTLAVRWSGFLDPNGTGEYLIGVRADGAARVAVDGKQIMQTYSAGASLGRAQLERGRPVRLEVEYEQGSGSKPEAQLIWAPVNEAPDPAAVAAAEEADVVVAVLGITSRLEGEEMRVEQPGFRGGDRTNLDIPKPEEDLVQALASTGKPLIVVLMNGSALAARWEQAHANAILESWYAGEEGGAAIAQTLSGKNNPAGRLPVTFYRDVEQLPSFEDYSMKGRTYRYFAGEPLWPFGYGLSYTQFRYSDLTLAHAVLSAGNSQKVVAKVTNTGTLAGDEVVQLYLTFPAVSGAPLRALRGFQRIHLAAGASQRVEFSLQPRDLSLVTDTGDIIVAAGWHTVSVGGGQPGTQAASITGRFEVTGRIMLPE